ncbi:MAG: hypothetical protein EPN60_17020 [Nevskiaceae bacterium]|nr:MAG: hypothetical protein EPN60_17020 [Nevskiaceae bacterium]
MSLHVEKNLVTRELLIYHRVGTRDYLIDILSAEEARAHGSDVTEAAKELMALKPTPAAMAEVAERR